MAPLFMSHTYTVWNLPTAEMRNSDYFTGFSIILAAYCLMITVFIL
jgi:hypothetical protein